eukprot:SAG31_NODE_1424_length_8394_cov_3.211814_6_plen_59_part_00
MYMYQVIVFGAHSYPRSRSTGTCFINKADRYLRGESRSSLRSYLLVVVLEVATTAVGS